VLRNAKWKLAAKCGPGCDLIARIARTDIIKFNKDDPVDGKVQK